METRTRIDRRLFDFIGRSPGCTIDDILLECRDLSWNQVFFALDRLTREGRVRLFPVGRGLYQVHLSHDAPVGGYQESARRSSHSSL